MDQKFSTLVSVEAKTKWLLKVESSEVTPLAVLILDFVYSRHRPNEKEVSIEAKAGKFEKNHLFFPA